MIIEKFEGWLWMIIEWWTLSDSQRFITIIDLLIPDYIYPIKYFHDTDKWLLHQVLSFYMWWSFIEMILNMTELNYSCGLLAQARRRNLKSWHVWAIPETKWGEKQLDGLGPSPFLLKPLVSCLFGLLGWQKSDLEDVSITGWWIPIHGLYMVPRWMANSIIWTDLNNRAANGNPQSS